MAAPGLDRDAMVALLQRLEESAAAMLPSILGVLSLVAGTVLLAFAPYRARAVPVWTCAALAIGMLGHLAAFIAGSLPALIATSALLLLGYGRIGAGLLRHRRRMALR